jgi:hypothetical protein
MIQRDRPFYHRHVEDREHVPPDPYVPLNQMGQHCPQARLTPGIGESQSNDGGRDCSSQEEHATKCESGRLCGFLNLDSRNPAPQVIR